VSRCNCCGYRGSFATWNGRRVRCPTCGSKPRHRVVAAVLERRPHWLEGRNVLHVAAEKCLRDLIEPAARVYRAPKRCNVLRLRYADEAFDLVLLNHVLQHVYDDVRALHELRRVLSPRGVLLLTVPTAGATSESTNGRETPAERLAKWGHPGHWRVYGRDNLVVRLMRAEYESAGWDDVRDWRPPPAADKLHRGLVFWALVGREVLS